jgi:DNA-binding response OmpR family regulator
MATNDIIYIEDDDQEALIMRISMRRHGVNVVHVPSVTLDAVHTLRQPPYDTAAALIFDARLGGYSGLELARSLRAAGETRPIALVTAGDNPDAALLRALNVHFFSKPLNYAALLTALRA